MPDPAVTGFLFGKLPAHGDFVARGLGAGERDALDDWLAGSLADARAALPGFDALYDQAPPWRFAWCEGEGWAAGAMAPSVDGAGRRYPLLLGVGDLTSDAVGAAAARVEELIYAALGEGWGADRLHAALAAAGPDGLIDWPGDEGWWTLGGERFTPARLPGARPMGLMRAVLTPAGEGWGA